MDPKCRQQTFGGGELWSASQTPVGDFSFPSAGGQGTFPPSLGGRARGSGPRAHAWPRAAPEPRSRGPAATARVRSSRRPLLPAVPKVGAFFGGRRSGAVRRLPATRPLSGPPGPGTPEAHDAGAAVWAHHLAPGQAKAVHGVLAHCSRPPRAVPDLALPHRSPPPPEPAAAPEVTRPGPSILCPSVFNWHNLISCSLSRTNPSLGRTGPAANHRPELACVPLPVGGGLGGRGSGS